MKIADSSVMMSSNRRYYENGLKGIGNGDSFEKKAEDALINSRTSRNNLCDELYGGAITGTGYNMEDNSVTGPSVFQSSVLNRLLNRMMTGGAWGLRYVGSPATGLSAFVSRQVTYEEYEETSFHANGQAKTEDGRTIDFNIDLLMSRSYMEYMDIQIPSLQDALLDPLVVNIGSGTAEVSDQTFMFDLDGDGTKERINMLGRGSGFLALDLNEDGVINDGNELFGTKTGDAFGDLRQYDSDGNGWIDENDEIFSKLKIWCKDDQGNDILMDLKEADIGAIFLGDAIASGSEDKVIDMSEYADKHTDRNVKSDRQKRREESDIKKAREEKRMKRKKLQEEYEQRLDERRERTKELMDEAYEERRDYTERLYEKYQWQQFKHAYNIVG